MSDYEEFTESQIKILDHFVTNAHSKVFALRNLPEVIKGALFSRYSRSSLGLRSLLLKEFILNEETAFDSIVGNNTSSEEDLSNQQTAIKKAQSFYDRILDGYGDDSIGELGGAHLAIENVSMIAAKAIEDCRIGGSPLEKSTRYVYFDQKVKGEYQFYREPILMTSAYKCLYLDTCDMLFEVYSKLLPSLTAVMEKKFPKSPETSKVAYGAALRAKVLDCLRGLLPASTTTNLGIFGNGRFFESLIQKLNIHNLSELQEIGKASYKELACVIPSFIRRADIGHKHQLSTAQFYESMREQVALVVDKHRQQIEPAENRGACCLIRFDADAVERVAAAMLYDNVQVSLESLKNYCAKLSEEEIAQILDAGCSYRENRRHKSPRALEHASFTFEMVSDFGVYRDLHRHRMLTQERQTLGCSLGYYIPDEIIDTDMEKEYRDAMEKAQQAHAQIAMELPEEAQYIVPMGYNLRWYFHVNLRALQWLCELRSAPQGHPTYRYLAQEMAKQVMLTFPQFERFFKFVNFDGYDLGRLGQEQQQVEKMHKGN